MKLTMGAVYATRALDYLAHHDGHDPLTARSLAEAGHIPERYVQKFLGYLVRAGVLAPCGGQAGGFRLSRPAKLVSLPEIVEAFEGPFSFEVTFTEGGAVAGCAGQFQALCDRVVEGASRRPALVSLADLMD